MKIYNDRPEKFSGFLGYFQKMTLFKIIFLAIFIITLYPIFLGGFYAITYNSTVSFTIKDKERVCYGRNVCKYLIYTNYEVFENTDSWLDAKYNSADLYNQLDPGKECTARVRGKRVEFYSWFRNIVEIYICK